MTAPGNLVTEAQGLHAAQEGLAVLDAPGPWRRRMNLLLWWAHQQLGWVGAIGLTFCLLGLLLGTLVIPRQQDSLRIERQRLLSIQSSKSKADQDAKPLPIPQGLENWRAQLPAWGDRTKVLGALQHALRASGLEVDRVDYTMEPVAPGLVRWRAAMPISAPYERVRQASAVILNSIPNAMLDSLVLERTGEGVNLTGQMSWSFLFRQTP